MCNRHNFLHVQRRPYSMPMMKIIKFRWKAHKIERKIRSSWERREKDLTIQPHYQASSKREIIDVTNPEYLVWFCHCCIYNHKYIICLITLYGFISNGSNGSWRPLLTKSYIGLWLQRMVPYHLSNCFCPLNLIQRYHIYI